MGAYGTVQCKMEKTIEGGRDYRKNQMRLVYFKSHLSSPHGTRGPGEKYYFRGDVRSEEITE